MFTLQELRKRTEGSETSNCYNSVLSNFHCVHKDSPPVGETDCPLLSCAFARKRNYGHVLAATCDDGRIMILNTEFTRKDNYPYTLQEVNTDAVFSVAWSEMDMKLITTSGNHNATLFNVHNDGSLTELNTFKAHKSSVKTACFEPNNADIFATGGRDGSIFIWDARSTRISADGDILPDNSILNCHMRNGASIKNSSQKQIKPPSITCLVYQDDHRLISCADKDSCIKVWDLRKTYQYMKKFVPVQELQCPDKKSSGYSHMVMNKNGTRLFASCTNNTIYCYNVTSYSFNLEHTYTGHQCDTFYVKCSLSPDEKYLASTDSLDKVYIWKVNASKDPIVMLDGIDKGLSDVSWCPADQLKLATTSDYPRPWIWSAVPKPKPNSKEEWSFELNSRLNPEEKSNGFAVHLTQEFPHKKYKKTFSMTSKLRKFVDDETELSQIVLPNAFVDGTYQTHTCTKIESKPSSLNNWLTNLHIQQPKESISPKSLSKLSIRNRVSPKVEKSPGAQNRSKSVKRKRLSMNSGGNNLTKYFKLSDENYQSV